MAIAKDADTRFGESLIRQRPNNHRKCNHVNHGNIRNNFAYLPSLNYSHFMKN